MDLLVWLIIIGFILAFLTGSLGDSFKFVGKVGIVIAGIYFITSASNPLAALFLVFGLVWLLSSFINERGRK